MALNQIMKSCPCGSHADYRSCCSPYITEQSCAPTPEALMRSRYTAYTLAHIHYIKKTMKGKALIGFNELEAKKWSQTVTWLQLKILNTEKKDETTGIVEFIATYMDKHIINSIHEISHFECINNIWFYMEGQIIPQPPVTVARSAPCPCDSKKKFKNCHGRAKDLK